MDNGGREWFCYEHGRVHDDAEQAWYCEDGEWREILKPQVSAFRAHWDEIFLRDRGQHPDQIEAAIRSLGTCRRDEPA